jgi:hypothetical protein
MVHILPQMGERSAHRRHPGLSTEKATRLLGYRPVGGGRYVA